MTISLIIFYYLYIAAVVIFLLFTLAILYHIFRFSYLTPLVLTIIIVYLVVTGLILGVAWELSTTVDWNYSIQLFPKIR